MIEDRLLSIPADQLALLDDTFYKSFTMVKAEYDAHIAKFSLESPIVVHSETCRDYDRCAADWHQAWYNIVGTALQNGRNPLMWEDAFKRLEKGNFGAMDPGCVAKMLEVANDSEPIVRGRRWVKEQAKELAAKVLEDPLDTEQRVRERS